MIPSGRSCGSARRVANIGHRPSVGVPMRMDEGLAIAFAHAAVDFVDASTPRIADSTRWVIWFSISAGRRRAVRRRRSRPESMSGCRSRRAA